MDNDINKLISLIMQLKRCAAHLQTGPLEEKIGTMLQLHVLFFLEKHPHATLSEISQFTGGSLSSTTQLINRLDKAGIVSRVSDDKDRRIIRHVLTQEGLTKLEQMREEKMHQAKKLFSTLDEKDIKTLITILEKLVKSHNK